MGKIIIIEGTDCSGKETQSKLLKKKLESIGHKTYYISFPNYESPTGKILGGPYLGKENISKSWFNEGAPNVDAKVSTLLFAADRLYNKPRIMEKLKEGYNVIIDRYTYSAMAHQGGKITNQKERLDFYQWNEELEFNLIGLPKPDIKIFLHMPFEAETILRTKRIQEELDDNEKDADHLKNAENAYLEIAKRYDFHTIQCIKESSKDIKSPEEISEEIWQYIKDKMIDLV